MRLDSTIFIYDSYDMNTQTHILLNLALLRKTGLRNASSMNMQSAFWGSLLPDLPMFVFFISSVIIGESQRRIWDELYFLPGWQTPIDIFNSIPIFLTILLVGILLRRRGIIIFAAAALLHVAGDFLLHHDDAHAHFFPFSKWRFSSPVSYWDPDHYGRIFVVVEFLMGAAATIILFRYYSKFRYRALLVSGNVLNLVGLVAIYIFAGGNGA